MEESLASLPPTRPALQEHTKWVYYQIQEWLGNQLEPENWGWKKCGFITGNIILPANMSPVMNPAPPAPEELLKSIHCSCQKCDTNRCTCRKSGIRYSELCKNCEGEICDNRSLKEVQNLSADDDGDEGENKVEDSQLDEHQSEHEEEEEELFDEVAVENPMKFDEMELHLDLPKHVGFRG
ncbi:unnamed protein product [Arctia plantaginis]|uniref:Tesmin/TSO1-like CXC domain-containing protein n=1 Tax=Arctia plantaginis TaxID=874455 RepID=A0A8S1A3U2_ARCPL|nr:unnamed protein product [Arctia plantaginis]